MAKIHERTNPVTAPTSADIDAIRERHAKHRNEVWFTPETIDALLAAVAERDATIERLTEHRDGARDALEMIAGALECLKSWVEIYRATVELKAEVARSTAERDKSGGEPRAHLEGVQP